MNNPIVMHCNYAEQGQTLEQMCQIATRIGYEGIEFRFWREVTGQTVEEYLDEIAHAVKKAKLKYVFFGMPGCDLMKPTADERQKEIDQYMSFYKEANKRFELTVCNTASGAIMNSNPTGDHHYEEHGSNIATEKHWKQAIEGFKILGQFAADLGFRFAFETHNYYLHDLIKSARKLVDEINMPTVGINLDLGNVILHHDGENEAEAVAIGADKIYLTHLKNFYRLPDGVGASRIIYLLGDAIMCPLSDGAINYRQVIDQLINEHGYTGPLMPEAYRPGDQVHFAKQDFLYLKSLLENARENKKNAQNQEALTS